MLKKRLAYFGLLAAAAMAVTAGLPYAALARTVGTCAPTKLKYVTSDLFNSTADGSFVAVPEISLAFVQGGTAPGCVIVEFSGQAFASGPGNALISVDARLDGNDDDNYFPPQPQLAANDVMWGVRRSVTLVFASVAPGPHNIKIYYRSANGGNVELNRPLMIVHHVP